MSRLAEINVECPDAQSWISFMKVLGALVAMVLVVWLSLVVTDSRVLVKETLVRPGQVYVVDGYGDLGLDNQNQLACWYFNGRGILPMVFWQSPNSIMGRDSCPFLRRASD
jgi:hypothetical protein